MGFFASRWIEKHGAASEKAALTTIINGLSVPSTSGSEGAGTVKSKWVSHILTLFLIFPESPFSTSNVQRSNVRRGPPPSRWLNSRAEGASRCRFRPLPTFWTPQSLSVLCSPDVSFSIRENPKTFKSTHLNQTRTSPTAHRHRTATAPSSDTREA